MCSSQRPTEGADSEPVEPVDERDTWCDYCGKTAYNGLRYSPMRGGINYLCAACYQREHPQTCDNCERPTTDFRLIDYGRAGLWRVCGVCLDKFEERYEQAVVS